MINRRKEHRRHVGCCEKISSTCDQCSRWIENGAEAMWEEIIAKIFQNGKKKKKKQVTDS